MRTEEKKNENVIEITEEVSISQEDGSTIILEAGDRIRVQDETLRKKTESLYTDGFELAKQLNESSRQEVYRFFMVLFGGLSKENQNILIGIIE